MGRPSRELQGRPRIGWGLRGAAELQPEAHLSPSCPTDHGATHTCHPEALRWEETLARSGSSGYRGCFFKGIPPPPTPHTHMQVRVPVHKGTADI